MLRFVVCACFAFVSRAFVVGSSNNKQAAVAALVLAAATTSPQSSFSLPSLPAMDPVSSFSVEAEDEIKSEPREVGCVATFSGTLQQPNTHTTVLASFFLRRSPSAQVNE